MITTTEIVAIASASAAFITIVVSLIQAKRSNRLSTIFSIRTKVLEQMRIANSEFVGRAFPEAIIFEAKKGTSSDYPVDICKAAALLKTTMKPYSVPEQKLLHQIDELRMVCLEQFNNPDTDLSKKINDTRIIYCKLYEQHDFAFWEFLKEQHHSNKHKVYKKKQRHKHKSYNLNDYDAFERFYDEIKDEMNEIICKFDKWEE